MPKDKIISETVDMPSDWPANEREARLSNVLKAVEDFKENPNYKKIVFHKS